MKGFLRAWMLWLALIGAAGAAGNLKFRPGEGAFHWDSFEALGKIRLDGQQLTVFGPWIGPDQPLIESVLAYFEAATGADVRYTGSDAFEQQIRIDTEAGSAPNIAIFPQPGLLGDLVRLGKVAPLTEADARWVRDNYAAGESWVALGSFAGPDGGEHFYGIFYKVDVKSLVWFVPENFEDAGYQIPTSMAALRRLTEQIAADGETPWCIGLGSGSATGWPATDWVEELMLRSRPAEVYDRWVDHRMPFDDPAVVAAIDAFGWFARNGKFVAGGAAAVATTDYRDSPKGLFSSPPQCYMHRQASFIPSYFPADTEIGADVDFFYFPADDDLRLGMPVLGAGTVVAITRDSPAARAFIEFLKSPIAHEVWMAQKGFLTPHKGVNTELYGDPTLRKMGDILRSADTFRFDASDLMPGAIGAGAFWTGMVDFVGGRPAGEVAGRIEAAWEALE